jgi:hypothetical protein
MPRKAKAKRKRAPKTILKLPDLEQSKSAVPNSLTSPSSRRSYDHAIREFIDWYCSEPRLAFNKTVVTRYRISLEQRHYAPSKIDGGKPWEMGGKAVPVMKPGPRGQYGESGEWINHLERSGKQLFARSQR